MSASVNVAVRPPPVISVLVVTASFDASVLIRELHTFLWCLVMAGSEAKGGRCCGVGGANCRHGQR